MFQPFDLAAECDFYVYIYHNPWTNEPVYVGKGRGTRAWDHQRRSHNAEIRALARKALKEGVVFEPSFIKRNLSRLEAIALETRTIKSIGRVDLGTGPLLNRTASNGENSVRHPIEINGMWFPSLAAASRHFGLPDTTIAARLKTGWSKEQAAGLEPPPNLVVAPVSKKVPITVCGVEYESKIAACRAHGIPWDNVKGRLKIGWSIDSAFTTPVKTHQPL